MAKRPTTRRKPVEAKEYQPRGYDVKQLSQRIRSEQLFEQLEFDPPEVPWLYIDNIITRVMARMLAQGPFGAVPIKATQDGSIAVVQRGGAFDDYERLDYHFTSAGTDHTFQFSKQVNRIDIFTYSGKVEYQLSRDLVKTLGDKIVLFEDSFYSLDFFTRRIKATCKSTAPKESGTNSTATDGHLIDSGATFQTNNVAIGDMVANLTEQEATSVTTVNSETDLSLAENIFPNAEGTGKGYAVEGTRVTTIGWFRVTG